MTAPPLMLGAGRAGFAPEPRVTIGALREYPSPALLAGEGRVRDSSGRAGGIAAAQGVLEALTLTLSRQ